MLHELYCQACNIEPYTVYTKLTQQETIIYFHIIKLVFEIICLFNFRGKNDKQRGEE